jgi:hypothetical protein
VDLKFLQCHVKAVKSFKIFLFDSTSIIITTQYS